MTDQAQMMTAEEFFTLLEGMERQESSGRGGYIGLISFEMGYNSFAPGLPPAERWFPFPARDQVARDAAKAAAKALGANIELSYCFKLNKASVKGRDVSSWQHPDRYFITTSWYDDAKQIVKPSLEALGIFVFPYQFWGRLTFKNSVRADPDAEKPDLVAYPAEIFASEAEAEKAAADITASKADEAIPGTGAADGPPAWLVDYVKKAEGKTPKELAEELGQDVAMIIAALGA